MIKMDLTKTWTTEDVALFEALMSLFNKYEDELSESDILKIIDNIDKLELRMDK